MGSGDDVIEPWRCEFCQRLIYNLDEDGYPAPGAPEAYFFSLEYARICSVCHAMASVLMISPYWKKLPDKSNRHLKPGGDYLSA